MLHNIALVCSGFLVGVVFQEYHNLVRDHHQRNVNALRSGEHSRAGYVQGFADAVKQRKFYHSLDNGWGNAQWEEIRNEANVNSTVQRQIEGIYWHSFGAE